MSPAKVRNPEKMCIRRKGFGKTMYESSIVAILRKVETATATTEPLALISLV